MSQLMPDLFAGLMILVQAVLLLLPPVVRVGGQVVAVMVAAG